MSPAIQNEIIHLIAIKVLTCIAADCQGKLFSILCDEVSDRSNNELLSIVICYIVIDNNQVLVKDCLIGLIQVDDAKASSICDVIVQKLSSSNISIDLLIAQCFDDASNMSGCYNGVQARLEAICPREPLFIHCWVHVLNLILQDVVKSVSLCSRTFNLLQKLYTTIEGSAQYMSSIADMHLDDGLQILQSLCSTRWAARCTNLRIVDRCLPVFIAANAASVALQGADIDLSAAVTAVESPKGFVKHLRRDGEFEQMYSASENKCSTLGIDYSCSDRATGKRRKISLLAALIGSMVLDSFVTKSSDAIKQHLSQAEQLKNEMNLDFYLPVLDTLIMSLNTRFNDESVAMINNISAILTATPDDEQFSNAIKSLGNIARVDSDVCLAEGKLLFQHDMYNKSAGKCTLRDLANTMITQQHNVAYSNFFNLILFLLTLPVTSASCERAHSKVDLVKSSIRASMTSNRLEDLVLISCEKGIVDKINLSAVVDRFAAIDRKLLL